MNLIKPTLLLDSKKCRENILYMKNKASEHHTSFRPHFKTHQSKSIGRWFYQEGIEAITVSSVDMANYFADAGWKDILIAFPLNINELNKINDLSEKTEKLYLTIENEEALEKLIKQQQNPIGIYLKIDAGYGRTGIKWSDTSKINKLVQKINTVKMLKLEGLLVHSGHTYHAESKQEIINIHNASIQRLNRIKEKLPGDNQHVRISIGDTPGCSIADNFEGADEIRPGNFVFYDLQQYKAGACNLSDIAVCLACPVVAKHEERSELIIYGGAVHFSKEFIWEGDQPVYGYGMRISDEGWIPATSRMILKKLSQEHGVVSVTPEAFTEFNVGDFIGFYPVHSCLTSNLMGGYLDLEGNEYDHLNGRR